MKKVIIYLSAFLLFMFVGCSSKYAGFQEGVVAYETAFQGINPLAEQGDADAQHIIGLMYYNGIGIPQDYVEAFKWYKMAAELGYAKAQYSFGSMYANGQGVPKDDTEAFKWFKMAAEQGDADAQGALGEMYQLGGVPKDNVMAYMWYELAAAQGNVYAIILRNTLEKEMPPEQITEAQRLSREFKVKKP